MAIRWRRGLFRLWLAMSAIWIALALWLTKAPDVWLAYWSEPYFEIKVPGSSPLLFRAGGKREEFKRTLTEYVKGNSAKVREACRQVRGPFTDAEVFEKPQRPDTESLLAACPAAINYRSELSDEDFDRIVSNLLANKHSQIAWEMVVGGETVDLTRAFNVAVVVFAPVIATFVLGILLAWVMRGFSAN